MISDARLRANRANAARSTGPNTPEGKARSSRNASRHGPLAKLLLVGNESPDGFQGLFDGLVQRFAPADDVEFSKLEEMAASYWRLRRAWSLETEMLGGAFDKQPGRGHFVRLAGAYSELAESPKLHSLHRYETHLQLMYQRALKHFLAIRQLCPANSLALPESENLRNEPTTPFPINKIIEIEAEKVGELAPNPAENDPKSTQNGQDEPTVDPQSDIR